MLSAHPFTYPSHPPTHPLPIYPPTPNHSSTHLLIHPSIPAPIHPLNQPAILPLIHSRYLPIHATPVHLNIHLPVYHPSIHITRIHIWLFILLFPTICSRTHPSTYHPASTHLSIRPFNPSTPLPRHSSAYPSTHPHTRPSNHLSTHPLTHPPSIYPHYTPRPTHHLRIYPPTHPTVLPLTAPHVHSPPLHLSISPPSAHPCMRSPLLVSRGHFRQQQVTCTRLPLPLVSSLICT